jgi:hypothetical protein
MNVDMLLTNLQTNVHTLLTTANMPLTNVGTLINVDTSTCPTLETRVYVRSALASTRQNERSPKCNDNISLLTFQNTISVREQRLLRGPRNKGKMLPSYLIIAHFDRQGDVLHATRLLLDSILLTENFFFDLERCSKPGFSQGSHRSIH